MKSVDHAGAANRVTIRKVITPSVVVVASAESEIRMAACGRVRAARVGVPLPERGAQRQDGVCVRLSELFVETMRSGQRGPERSRPPRSQCMVLCIALRVSGSRRVRYITCRDGGPLPGPKQVDSYYTNIKLFVAVLQ